MNSASGRHSSGRQPLFLAVKHNEHGVRLLATRVDLNEDVQRVGAFSKKAGGIKFLSQLDAVHAFDYPEVGDLANQLITLATLQVANKVPANILRKSFGLVQQLLDIVFAKVTMTIVVQLLDRFGRLLLADSHDSWLFLSPINRAHTAVLLNCCETSATRFASATNRVTTVSDILGSKVKNNNQKGKHGN